MFLNLPSIINHFVQCLIKCSCVSISEVSFGHLEIIPLPHYMANVCCGVCGQCLLLSAAGLKLELSSYPCWRKLILLSRYQVLVKCSLSWSDSGFTGSREGERLGQLWFGLFLLLSFTRCIYTFHPFFFSMLFTPNITSYNCEVGTWIILSLVSILPMKGLSFSRKSVGREEIVKLT